MPRWDFYCASCDNTRELSFPSFDKSKRAKCEKCNKKLERLPAAGLPQFKGGGFYATDYQAKS